MSFLRRARGPALGVFAALWVASFVDVAQRRFTCVACRLTRTDITCLGVTRSRSEENVCSRWYAGHVEPSHAHVWEPGTCTSHCNLLGMRTAVGCRPGAYPIWLLSPTTQLGFYQHVRDPREAKALFESLTDEKLHDDRLDEDAEDRGHLSVRAIEEWESAGFPGTWPDWWKRFEARYVAEHREWLEWLHSKSDMNFDDWKARRKKGH